MRHAGIAFSLALLASVALGADRLFVRTSSDGLQTEIGDTAISGARTGAIRFTLAQSEPERVTLTIKESTTSSKWSVTLESRIVTKPHVLHASRGVYELTFSAPHHRPLHRKARVDNPAAVNLGTLTLVRYPLLTGNVRSSDGSPVGGAFVTDRRKLSAKSDTLGAFALEIDSDWPSQIEVSYPGLTTREIAIPKAQISTRLAAVTLSKGSRIAVEIDALMDGVDVDLAAETSYKHLDVLKTVHVSKDSARATFEDLDKGEYIVVVRGGGPLQKLAALVAVGEGESVTRRLRIDPIAVDIEVRRGDSLIAQATVTVQSDGNRWASDVRTGSDGHADHEAWQRGQYVFAVRAKEASPPVILLDQIDGKSEAWVRLEVPDRSITGQVTDAEDGSPVASAEVHVESSNDDTTGGTLTTVAGPDGKFVIDGLRDGSHTLTVEAENYFHSEPITVRVDQTTPRRDAALRVSHGLPRALRVTTRSGLPVRDAMAVETLGNTVTGIFMTDEMGSAILRVPPDAAVTVYVLPAEGSFAIAHLGSKPVEGEESIVVPDGNATLELHAKDSAGKPLSGIEFAMRYEGELIPLDILDLLERRRGIRSSTGPGGVARLDRLPTGFLELWPIRTKREWEQILAGGVASAPVQVALKDGLNVATMTFKRRR